MDCFLVKGDRGWSWVIAACHGAVIGGAETWEDVELYGPCKDKWFKKFLKLPNGIPSHDTFNRVFARSDPEQLQECFLNLRNKLIR